MRIVLGGGFKKNLPGEMIKFDFFFQMGWFNHQLDLDDDVWVPLGFVDTPSDLSNWTKPSL